MSLESEEIGRRFDAVLSKGLRRAWQDGPSALHRDAFDVSECARELNSLRSGGDLCYDRPGSAIAYAAWYHGERVNQFIRVLDQCPELANRDREWQVVDLGAGTGAVAWAMAARELMASSGRRRRYPIRLSMVESSRPMLSLAWVLWRELLSEFENEGLRSLVMIDQSSGWRHESWPTLGMAATETDLLTAHYLFDYSETDPAGLAESVRLFRKQMRHQRVARLLCCTTSQKRPVLNRLRQELASDDWSATAAEVSGGPLRGLLSATGEFRRSTLAVHVRDKQLRARTEAVPSYEGNARTPATVLSAATSNLFQDLGSVADVLTSEQEGALNDRSVNIAVKGSAGSGKTLLLTLRLARFARSAAAASSVRTALFTSFNKNLVAWVAHDAVKHAKRENPGVIIRLEPSGVGVSGTRWLTVAGRKLICFSTLDSVAAQAFDYQPGSTPGSDGNVTPLVRQLLGDDRGSALVQQLPEQACPVAGDGEPVVAGTNRSLEKSARYISEEFRVVFYGRAQCKPDIYLDPVKTSREGRGVRLTSVQRTAMVKLLSQINHKFTNRRCSALSSQPKRMFSAIVVDEAQDFTDQDFNLARKLLVQGGSLTLAFDSSQAIRTGVTFRLPKVSPGWSWHSLTGSYRMPLRVCEALVPVVNYLRTEQSGSGIDAHVLASPPVPSRIAVLGSRPFVIAAHHESDFADRFAALVDALEPRYDPQSHGEIVVLESDKGLRCEIAKRFPPRVEPGKGSAAQKSQIVPAESFGSSRVSALASSVLREKGMEFPWVVWSTRAPCDEPLDLHRLCYTIVSRCTRHLVIWLELDDTGRPDPAFASLFCGPGSLRRDRLVVLDENTQMALGRFDPP